jgi:Uncharacterized conserved protein
VDAVDLMKEEHEYIKRALQVIRNMSLSILESGEVYYEDFESVIEFIRNYADKHHHNKEEVILFKKMEEQIGQKVKAPLSGMFIEHDLGRLFISNLEAALQRVKNGYKDSRIDVIANAVVYADLLNRHIDKEDNAIYSFARRSLNAEALEEVNNACSEVEKSAMEKNTQETYIKILKSLEKKWN